MKKICLVAVILISALLLSVSPVWAADAMPDHYLVDTSGNMTAWAWEALGGSIPATWDDPSGDSTSLAVAAGWAKRCAFFWAGRAAALATTKLSQDEFDAAQSALDTAGDTGLEFSNTALAPVFKEWATNDVAACYFIAGEVYRMSNEKVNADVQYGKVTGNTVFDMAVGISVNAAATKAVSPIWKITDACSDRKDLSDSDSELYKTPLN